MVIEGKRLITSPTDLRMIREVYVRDNKCLAPQKYAGPVTDNEGAYCRKN